VRLRILVRGAIQGVGFRPFVHRRATALGLSGWVKNSSEGVVVEAEGGADDLSVFVETIRRSPPKNAVVTAIEVHRIEPHGEAAFAIRLSETTGTRTAQLLPDLATCADCLTGLFSPTDRRYRYPLSTARNAGRASASSRLRLTTAHEPQCVASRCVGPAGWNMRILRIDASTQNPILPRLRTASRIVGSARTHAQA
jgi:acylphosphatase